MVLAAVAAFVARQTLWLNTTTVDDNAPAAARPVWLALLASSGAAGVTLVGVRFALWPLRQTLWGAISTGVALAWLLSLSPQTARPVAVSPMRLALSTWLSSALLAGAAGGVWAHLRFLDVERVKAGDFSRQLAAVLVVETLVLAPAATVRTRQALLRGLFRLPRVIPAPALPLVAPLVLGLSLAVLALLIRCLAVAGPHGHRRRPTQDDGVRRRRRCHGRVGGLANRGALQIGLAEGQDPPDLRAIFRRNLR